MKPERLRRNILPAPYGDVPPRRRWLPERAIGLGIYIDGIQGKDVSESVEQPPTVVALRT
jgi:hypothetical protein